MLTVKRIMLASVVLLLVTVGPVLAGCESLDGSSTTVLGGATGPGDTVPAGATTLTSVATGATVTPGGTPVTGGSGDSILGKWHNSVTGETLEFFPNGVVTGSRYADMKGIEVTYAINADQITISALGTILVTQTFSISGGTLTIIDNETGISGTLQRAG